MKQQKVCIIGGGLTGLITAATLSKLNLKIDIVMSNITKNMKSNRTIAISQNNYDFLKNLNIFKTPEKYFWPSMSMKLYTKIKNELSHEIFDINSEQNQKKKILYMIENSVMVKQILNFIKKNKSISLIQGDEVTKINSSGILKSVHFKKKERSKYNLVIVCTGSNSNLVNALFSEKAYKRTYNETSITTVLEHNYLKNNTVRQIFLDEEILALLPISNTKTSVVWTIRKNKLNEHSLKQNLVLKNKIKLYSKDFFENVKFNKNIEYKDLIFLIRRKYYKERILLFGDALHVVHPMVGQGFNMILRDLMSLKKIINKKINLGLDIGSSDILSEFLQNTKPGNFIYSMGIDSIKKFFDIESRNLKNFRNVIIKKLNKNTRAKNIFFNLADKGIEL